MVFYTADGKKSSFSDWFFGIYNPSYRPCMKINKPRVFIGSAGTEYVNFFPEILQGSKPKKQFKDFSIEVQQKVNKVWEHLNIVWCSRKKEQFEYCKLWFAKTISGVKMTTAINLKSIKGIGKSAFIDFLRKSVLGNDVIYQTSDTNIISGRFNSPLCGKMLFILEEAPCATQGEWKVLDSKLKNFITEHTISIERKGKDQIDVDNYASFVLFSNKNSVTYSHDERRYFSPDTSSDMKGNKKYFDEFYKLVGDLEVGEAFYWNCIEMAEANTKWHEQFNMPVTDEHMRNVSDNIPSVIQYVKDNFVLSKKGINMKASDFYENYRIFCQREKILYQCKKGAMIAQLKEIGINYIERSTKHHNQNWIYNTFEELFKIFKIKHLIHKTDDFENEDNIKQDDTDVLEQDNENTNVSTINIETIEQECENLIKESNELKKYDIVLESKDNIQINSNNKLKICKKFNLDYEFNRLEQLEKSKLKKLDKNVITTSKNRKIIKPKLIKYKKINLDYEFNRLEQLEKSKLKKFNKKV